MGSRALPRSPGDGRRRRATRTDPLGTKYSGNVRCTELNLRQLPGRGHAKPLAVFLLMLHTAMALCPFLVAKRTKKPSSSLERHTCKRGSFKSIHEWVFASFRKSDQSRDLKFPPERCSVAGPPARRNREFPGCRLISERRDFSRRRVFLFRPQKKGMKGVPERAWRRKKGLLHTMELFGRVRFF